MGYDDENLINFNPNYDGMKHNETNPMLAQFLNSQIINLSKIVLKPRIGCWGYNLNFLK